MNPWVRARSRSWGAARMTGKPGPGREERAARIAHLGVLKERAHYMETVRALEHMCSRAASQFVRDCSLPMHGR